MPANVMAMPMSRLAGSLKLGNSTKVTQMVIKRMGNAKCTLMGRGRSGLKRKVLSHVNIYSNDAAINLLFVAQPQHARYAGHHREPQHGAEVVNQLVHIIG